MVRYCLYVSASRLTGMSRFSQVERLVEDAQRRNEAMGLTGALIFSGSRFAQFLEGPRDAVEGTLQKIWLDDRHERITVLRDGRADCRRFGNWTLSYSGPSLYVDRHIKSLVGLSDAGVTRVQEVDRLLALLDTTSRAATRNCQTTHTIARVARM